MAEALPNEDLMVYGIDASPTLAAAFRRRLPHAPLGYEAGEHSRFFDRTFDGMIAVGVMLLLPAEVQRATIQKVGRALNAGGKFLFSAPAQQCTWSDVLTDRQSLSLGAEASSAVLSEAGLTVVGEHEDEGGNHYYDTHGRDSGCPACPAGGVLCRV
jgi:hypothetical protein